MIEFRKIWYYLTRYIDGLLLAGILTLMLVGLIVLYSATGANINKVSHQMINMLVALIIMWLVANIPLQQKILADENFQKGGTNIHYLEKYILKTSH